MLSLLAVLAPTFADHLRRAHRRRQLLADLRAGSRRVVVTYGPLRPL